MPGSIVCFLGALIFLAIAVGLSENRTAINWRTVGVALFLQVFLGAIALFIPQGKALFAVLSSGVGSVISYGTSGIEFLFGDIGSQKLGFIFAFHVLPAIIFFSSLMAVLYYVGVMGWVVATLGGLLQRLLKTSRAESISATANIFVSQTEAPVVVRPFVAGMTRSELFAVMVGGMATIAGSLLAGYVGLGIDLSYLLAASFMAAPGGLLMAKLILPETASAQEQGHLVTNNRDQYTNLFDAAAGGATTGLALAVNIGAMLLAFISLIALFNGFVGWVGQYLGYPDASLQSMLGVAFRPIAVLLGVPWSESALAGSLIGQKLVLNEFVAYVELSRVHEQLSPYSQAVVTIALCGFANFASIAIQLGGLGTMAPERRSDLAQLGLRAVIAAFLANLMSAAIAGFFLAL